MAMLDWYGCGDVLDYKLSRHSSVAGIFRTRTLSTES
jgi:hypothetical protein